MTQALYVHGAQDPVDYVASEDTAAGTILDLGSSLVGVTLTALKNGELGGVARSGVFACAKGSSFTGSAGDAVDWDEGDEEIKAAGDGDFELGVLETAAVSGETRARVAINQTRGYEPEAD